MTSKAHRARDLDESGSGAASGAGSEGGSEAASGAGGRVRVVAIDGPAGAGKSSLARAISEHLGLPRLDTGAMYRAVAYQALLEGADPSDKSTVSKLARDLHLEVGERVVVNGADATRAIRTPEVDAAVSIVAANPEVREEMVARQRRWVEEHRGGVVEGRDIGTVVLPHADLKVYLTASPEERARRRALERGESDLPRISRAMVKRDHLDSTRATSPLPSVDEMARDALVIDSTGRDLDAVVEEVLDNC